MHLASGQARPPENGSNGTPGSGDTAEVNLCTADKSSDLWEGSNGASGSGATAESC